MERNEESCIGLTRDAARRQLLSLDGSQHYPGLTAENEVSGSVMRALNASPVRGLHVFESL